MAEGLLELVEEGISSICSFSSSSPTTRNICLKRALEEYERDDFVRSVFYQTQALCTGAHPKYYFNQFQGRNPASNLNYTQKVGSLSRKSKLKEFFRRPIDVKIQSVYPLENETHSKRNSIISAEDVDKGINSLLRSCMQFPDEWTIIQLCKGFSAKTTVSFNSEIFLCKEPIYVTVLHHSRSKMFPEPICIKLDTESALEDVLEKFYYINIKIREACCFEGKDDAKNRAKFWKRMESLENELKELIGDLRDLLGPWKCFFCGSLTESNKIYQEKLFEQVDSFSEKYNLNDRIIVILSMLAKNINMLSIADIQTASAYMEKASKSTVHHQVFINFMTELSNHTCIESNNFTPCILIIDEVLDHIFWEMINPAQEMCRISSFYMLEKLFKKFHAKIENGYVRIAARTGSVVINPDNTLITMQQRMSSFFSYWLPNWNCISGETPSNDEMLELISSTDVFIYCGHGSGLQYVNGFKITQLNVDSVVFLFGCDSVKLKSEGLHSEMIGSHIYYHAALSPAVVGCSVVVFDFQLDCLSTKILSTWSPSKTTVHWSKVDKCAWKKGEKIAILENNLDSSEQFEPRLSLILSNIRADKSEKIYNRVSLIYRGLPVWNTCVE